MLDWRKDWKYWWYLLAEEPPLSWRCFLTLSAMLLAFFIFGYTVTEDVVSFAERYVHYLIYPVRSVISMAVGGGIGYWLSFVIYRNVMDVKALKKFGQVGLSIELVVLSLIGIALSLWVMYANLPVSEGGTPYVLEKLNDFTFCIGGVDSNDLDDMDMFGQNVTSDPLFYELAPQRSYRFRDGKHRFYDEWGNEIHIVKDGEVYYFVSDGPNGQYDNRNGDDLFEKIYLKKVEAE